MTLGDDRRQIFFTNIQLLGFDENTRYSYRIKTKFTVDTFKVANKAAFEAVMHFMFDKLNHSRCKEEFRDCWPVTDKSREQLFRRVCLAWLTQISQGDPDAHLPRVVPSLLQSPGGDKFCHLLAAFSSYVIRQVILTQHGMKSRETLQCPVLTPQALAIAPAMERSILCSAVSQRRSFFDLVQTRELLNDQMQKHANELVAENRKLNRALREREASIRALLETHSDKGMRSPVRMDLSRRNTSPASKHGRVFDVNVEAVKRSEKVDKVRGLWKRMDAFMSESREQQEVVSSIVTGVINKHTLSATALDLRVPEMLLRECERELLKRDVGNTYKAGKLDLVSVLHLWNLALHLYLERFEETPLTKDLLSSLDGLKSQVQRLQENVKDAKELRNTLVDDLIPDLRESIHRLKSKYHTFSGNHSLKSGLPIHEKTPTVTFSSENIRPEQLAPFKLSDTPQDGPTGSTPDAVARIMKAVRRTVQRTPCSDVTNNTSQRAPPNPASPLTQGSVMRARGIERSDPAQIPSDITPQRPRGQVQVKRVGVKQLTTHRSDGVISPDSNGENELSRSNGKARVCSPLVKEHNGSRLKAESDVDRQNALLNLSAQVVRAAASPGIHSLQRLNVSLPAKKAEPKSAIDRLVDRVVADIENFNESEEKCSAEEDNSPLHSLIDEIDMTGFVSKDKIARTPVAFGDQSGCGTEAGQSRHVYATPDRHNTTEILSDSEDDIVTASGGESKGDKSDLIDLLTANDAAEGTDLASPLQPMRTMPPFSLSESQQLEAASRMPPYSHAGERISRMLEDPSLDNSSSSDDAKEMTVDDILSRYKQIRENTAMLTPQRLILDEPEPEFFDTP